MVQNYTNLILCVDERQSRDHFGRRCHALLKTLLRLADGVISKSCGGQSYIHLLNGLRYASQTGEYTARSFA